MRKEAITYNDTQMTVKILRKKTNVCEVFIYRHYHDAIRQISLNNVYSAPWIFLMEMENCLSRLRGVTENIEYTIDD